jgi:hypothetical protein
MNRGNQRENAKSNDIAAYRSVSPISGGLKATIRNNATEATPRAMRIPLAAKGRVSFVCKAAARKAG